MLPHKPYMAFGVIFCPQISPHLRLKNGWIAFVDEMAKFLELVLKYKPRL